MTLANEQLEQAKQHIRNRWWVFGLWGIATIILGIYLITQPAITTFVMLQVMAIFLLISGLFDLIGVLLNRKEAGWGWRVVASGLSFIIGLIILANPLGVLGLTLGGLFLILAVTLVITGLVKILLGVRQQGVVGRRWTLGGFLIGAVQVLAGLVLLEFPLAGSLTLIVVLGVLAIGGGILALVFTWRVRQLT